MHGEMTTCRNCRTSLHIAPVVLLHDQDEKRRFAAVFDMAPLPTKPPCGRKHRHARTRSRRRTPSRRCLAGLPGPKIDQKSVKEQSVRRHVEFFEAATYAVEGLVHGVGKLQQIVFALVDGAAAEAFRAS